MTGWRGDCRVLLTGASGLVGHAVGERLRADGVRVVAVGRERDLAQDAWPSGPWHVIIHCAARLPSSFEGPDADAACAENRRLDDHAIDLAARSGAHLVYLSSGSVYGSARGDIDEDTPPAPAIGYAREKLATETAIAASGVSATVFRLIAPYGPRQHRVTVLRRFLDAALTGAPLRYFGTGRRTQDFIHVDDVAGAVARAARDRAGARYVLASGTSVSMRELAELVVEVTGSRSPVEAAGTPDPEENRRVRYRIERLRDELGFVPSVLLREGLAAWAGVRRAELAGAGL